MQISNRYSMEHGAVTFVQVCLRAPDTVRIADRHQLPPTTINLYVRIIIKFNIHYQDFLTSVQIIQILPSNVLLIRFMVK